MRAYASWWKRRWVRSLLGVLAACVVIRCSVADVGRVAGGSMRPTLHDGDRILTNKLAYGVRLPGTSVWAWRWSEPQRGEVVLLASPVDGRRLVKRVVAGPGDEYSPGVTVPLGRYYVQGDNANSVDSGRFGCVPVEAIEGRVVGVVGLHDYHGRVPYLPLVVLLTHDGSRVIVNYAWSSLTGGPGRSGADDTRPAHFFCARRARSVSDRRLFLRSLTLPTRPFH